VTTATGLDEDLSRAATAAAAGARRRRAMTPQLDGIVFHELLPFDAWCDAGTRITLLGNASAWWLGDWIVFGQRKYGRRYKCALTITRLDYQTLRNYASVARRFPPERRRRDLSFQHHAEVAALDDEAQDRWLDAAQAGHWSRNELRRRMKRVTATAETTSVIRLTVTNGEREQWTAAAVSAGIDFDRWVRDTLDGAAARVRRADAETARRRAATAVLPAA
jgi:hypothetical protein